MEEDLAFFSSMHEEWDKEYRRERRKIHRMKSDRLPLHSADEFEFNNNKLLFEKRLKKGT